MLKCINTKKFKLFFAMISLLILTNSIQESYAKYISSASAISNFSIANWTFMVNDQDVLNQSDFSTTIVPVIDSNSNIKAGVIAPTSTGYFDINIDYSDVDVAFTENISISYLEDNCVSDLVIVGYKLNNGELISVNAGDVISINHAINETTTTDNYRFYVQWIDGSGETMNNDDDTEAASEGVAKLKVNLNFIQKAN